MTTLKKLLQATALVLVLSNIALATAAHASARQASSTKECGFLMGQQQGFCMSLMEDWCSDDSQCIRPE